METAECEALQTRRCRILCTRSMNAHLLVALGEMSVRDFFCRQRTCITALLQVESNSHGDSTSRSALRAYLLCEWESKSVERDPPLLRIKSYILSSAKKGNIVTLLGYMPTIHTQTHNISRNLTAPIDCVGRRKKNIIFCILIGRDLKNCPKSFTQMKLCRTRPVDHLLLLDFWKVTVFKSTISIDMDK